MNVLFVKSQRQFFIVFLKCKRLGVLFDALAYVFLQCNVIWSDSAFIFGAGYKKENAKKWQLLNFVVGQAKLAIYKSRKSKIVSDGDEQGVELLPLFKALVKARIRVDFGFYLLMDNIDEFVSQWCYNDALCSVVEEQLVFSLLLL